MSVFNWFRRKPTYSFRIAQTTRGKWLWEVVDDAYHAKALQPAPFHPTRDEAAAAARRFCQGLGANYREYEG